jgi:glycyl-tRNA synthetase
MIKKVKELEKNVVEEKFEPNVIEPAFGLGRIITAILEHNYNIRPEVEEK